MNPDRRTNVRYIEGQPFRDTPLPAPRRCPGCSKAHAIGTGCDLRDPRPEWIKRRDAVGLPVKAWWPQ